MSYRGPKNVKRIEQKKMSGNVKFPEDPGRVFPELGLTGLMQDGKVNKGDSRFNKSMEDDHEEVEEFRKPLKGDKRISTAENGEESLHLLDSKCMRRKSSMRKHDRKNPKSSSQKSAKASASYKSRLNQKIDSSVKSAKAAISEKSRIDLPDTRGKSTLVRSSKNSRNRENRKSVQSEDAPASHTRSKEVLSIEHDVSTAPGEEAGNKESGENKTGWLLESQYNGKHYYRQINHGIPNKWQISRLRDMCKKRYEQYKSLNGDDIMIMYPHYQGEEFEMNDKAEEYSQVINSVLAVISKNEAVNSSNRSSEDRSENMNLDYSSPLPQSYQEAMNSKYGEKWKSACDAEMESLIKYETFELCELPVGRKPLGCRWVFTVKSDNTFKARLVTKGYHEIKDIDYKETFAPVIRQESVRILLATAAILEAQVHQMDVKTAFLNGELEEEIYMRQPQGYVHKEKPNWVLRLTKSLYGLKQAPHAWNKRFDEIMNSLDMIRSACDPCLYYRRKETSILVLGLYVDDILLFGTYEQDVQNLKNDLRRRLEVKDLGLATKFLGMNIDQTSSSISLSLRDYCEKLIYQFDIGSWHGRGIPYTTTDLTDYGESENDLANATDYRSKIGKLLFAANSGRPDLAFRLSQLSRYLQNPKAKHLKCVNEVLRYIILSKSVGIHFQKGGNLIEVKGYSDSDWGNNKENSKSTSGIVFTMAGGPIIWSAKLQTSVALSTTEAELIALSETSKTAIWITNMFMEIFSIKMKINIGCDNNSTIMCVKQPSHHSRVKHIRIRLHFLQNEFKKKSFDIVRVTSQENPADLFTKELGKNRFDKLKCLLNIR